MPPGITLTGATLAGTPTAAGTFGFIIETTDRNGCSDTRSYSITIMCPAQTLTPAALPAGRVGTAYPSTAFAASGMPGSYTFSSTGSMPPGLTLTAGTISGTPTANGTFSFPITATNTTTPSCSVTNNYSVKICSNVVLAPATFPSATTGTPYKVSVNATGGVVPYNYVLDSRTPLPGGLTLSSSGDIIGTPTAAGTFNFTIIATDAQSCSDTQGYTIDVKTGCPTITVGGAPANGMVGTAYKSGFTISGGATPHTTAITSGALPPGLTLSGDTIAGTPTTAGEFRFTVTVNDANKCPGSATFTVLIAAPPGCPAIKVGGDLPAGRVGLAYKGALLAEGGAGSFTFSVSAGLPPGVVVDADGTVRGTPTASGDFRFTATATDKEKCTGSAALIISIAAAPGCPSITVSPAALPNATLATTYRADLSATGGAAPYAFAVTAGVLPPGISLSGGVLTGTPNTAGRYTFTITAADTNKCAGSASYTIEVVAGSVCPSLRFSPGSLAPATVGDNIKTDIAATGGTAPYTYAITGGALPPGFTFSAGTLSGQARMAGDFKFTVTATDANKCSGTASYILTVAPAGVTCPAITLGPATLPNARVGTDYKASIAAAGGAAPYTYSLTGSLPPGMSLSGDTIAGNPTTAGTFQFGINALDANKCAGSGSFSLVVAPQAIACSSEAPSLASPAGGSTFDGTAPITFSWSVVKRAIGYDVLISEDGGRTFSTAASTSGESATRTTVSPKSGKFVWMVRANFGPDCKPTTSSSLDFSVVAASNCPSDVPRLSSPADGATDVGNVVVFQWSVVPNALQYRVSIAVNNGPATVVGMPFENALKIEVPSGTITWFVEAIFKGCPATRSSTFKFTTIAPAAICSASPEATKIIAPADGATVTPPVNFQWAAVNGASGYRVFAGVNEAAPSLVGQTTSATSLSVAIGQGKVSWYVETLFGRCASSISARAAFTVSGGNVTCNNPAVTLSSPANGAASVTSPVTFIWQGQPNALSYQLFASINGSAFQLLTTTRETTAARILAPGTVEWFVAAEYAGCEPVKSNTFRFVVVEANANRCSSTATITLTAPAANASVSSPVTFNWTAVSGATAYRLYVAVDGGTPVVVAKTETPGATVPVTSGSAVAFVEALLGDCPPVVSPRLSFSVQQANTCSTNQAPSVVSPIGSEGAPATVTSPVEFRWNGSANVVGYRLHISPAGQPFGDFGTTKETSLTRELKPGLYSWRIESLFAGCPPLVSTAAFFRIAETTPRCSTQSPAIISPADGATNTTSPVTFLWSSVGDAVAYRVYASINGAERYLVDEVDGTVNSVTASVAPGVVLWNVEAVLKECASTNSPRARFTVAPATVCPREKPQLLSPRNGSTNVTSPVTFAWTPISGAVRYVVIAKTETGSATPIGETASETKLERPLPAASLIEWWVIASVPGCSEIESDHSTFSIPALATCDGRGPVLRTPLEGSRETTTPTRFSWLNVPRATGYRLFITASNGIESLAAAGAATEAVVTVPAGLVKWFVEATFDACPPVRSAVSSFTYSPAIQGAICGSPERPVAYAVGKALAGTDYNVRFVPVPNAGSYEVQESTSADFSRATTQVIKETVASFVHDVSVETAYYYRVRAISSCNDQMSQYSQVVLVNIVPVNTIATNRRGTAEIGVQGTLLQTLFIEGGPAPISFSATGDKPWMNITPSSGIIPVEGLTLTVTADSSFLDVGSNNGTVQITYGGAGAGKKTVNAGQPTTVPVNVSLVTPVIPGGKNGPQLDSLIIPAVAHAQGANNALFESDVRVVNTSTQTMKYQLNFTPSRTDGTVSGSSTTIQIAPGGTAALDDILASFFGTATSDFSTGSMEIRPITTSTSSSAKSTGPSLASPTVASSRTYNLTANGTFGQFVPAVSFANFIGKNTDGTRALLSLQQIAESSAYRTNFGLVEGSGAPAQGMISVFDKLSSLVAEIPFSLLAGEHQQLDRLLSNNGISLEEGRIEVEVLSDTGKVTAYASTIDNRTNDPLLVSPVLKSSISNTRYVIPGVAYIDGAAKWRSDIRLFNAGSKPTNATITFFPQENPTASMSQEVTIAAGEVFASDNILNTMFGITAPFVGGSILVTTPETTSIIATARTYAQTDNGTYGQFVPAVTPNDSIGVGTRSLNILQVEQSVNMRTNIGLVETTGKSAEVEVSLVLPDVKATPKVTFSMQPNAFMQFNVASFNVGNAIYNARIVVKVTGGTGKVSAYGSVIDNKTADPTYVPAQ
jgi:hypothetical protein